MAENLLNSTFLPPSTRGNPIGFRQTESDILCLPGNPEFKETLADFIVWLAINKRDLLSQQHVAIDKYGLPHLVSGYHCAEILDALTQEENQFTENDIFTYE